ncbi:MAG: dihydropteroate synthase-like protein [Methermicoccaceae archaeon]
MRALLVTGNLADKDVREAVSSVSDVLKERGIDIVVDTLDIDVAAFIGQRKLSSHLASRQQQDIMFDLIIVPGLITTSFDTVEKRFGIPVRLGPKHAYDLRYVLPVLADVELSTTTPACSLLADLMQREARGRVEKAELSASYAFMLKDIKIGGTSRPKVFAEVVDTNLLTDAELRSRILYFEQSGADIIDLGFSVDADISSVSSAVRVARRTTSLPISIDSMEPSLVVEGADAGCDLVLSIDGEVLDYVEGMGKGLNPRVAYVVVPDRHGGIVDEDSLYVNIERIRTLGASKLLADPVLEPFGGKRKFVTSVSACMRFHERHPDIPLFFGIGNVVELFDADSVGLNACLTAIGYELGAGVLFTPEYSPKARGSVAELRRACEMMMLSAIRSTSPKDLGLDLLILKEKRRRPQVKTEGCVDALKKEHWRCDPKGAYLIGISDDGYIVARREDDGMCIRGRTAKEVSDHILMSGGVSLLEHAMYLGRELERAELAIRLGRSFAQDDEF